MVEPMLWKKESQDGESVYANIIGVKIAGDSSAVNKFKTGLGSDTFEATFAKNSAAVSAIQNLGLDLARDKSKKSEELIKNVNMMLCFSETGCGRVGMMYGFRGKLYVSLRQHSFALADFDKAQENKCPPEMLEDWMIGPGKCECKCECGGDYAIVEQQNDDAPKLSFPAHEKIPCFAQVLEVKHSKKFGNYLVTNEDLEIGQTVVVEEAYSIASMNDEKYSQCANCFERKANLHPCPNCSAVMFCSQECNDVGHEQFHALECGKPGVYSHWQPGRRIVMATVVKAIKLFPTIEELMDVTEKCRNEKSNIEESYTDPEIRAYLQFFGLYQKFGRKSNKRDLKLMDCVDSIHALITSDSAYESKFRSLKETRFLAHLILHHLCVVDAYGFFAFHLLRSEYVTELDTGAAESSCVTYADAIYLNSCHLKHSCQPNIARIFMGNKLVGKVLRPIKRGEQLFVSYMEPMGLLQRTEIRKRFLAANYNVHCKCQSCSLHLPPFESSGDVKPNVAICRMLNLFKDSQRKNPAERGLSVDEAGMLKYEKLAIDFLKSNDHLHPTRETLRTEAFLMQIWNTLGR